MLRSYLLCLSALFATACATSSESRVASASAEVGSIAGSASEGDAALASATSPARPVEGRRARIRRILDSNVRLEFRDGEELKRTASGVVIASESSVSGASSWIVTNAHTLDDKDFANPRLLVAVERDGREQTYHGEVVAVGRVPDLDLALLRVRGVLLPAAPLAEDGDLEVGEEVVVAASPFGNSVSLASGMVSRLDRQEDGVPKMLKTDAPVGYGSSGGGIFSLETGRLLAVVEGYRTARMGFNVEAARYSFEVPMPGETFAAPVTKVRAFLQGSGFGHLLDSERAPAVQARARSGEAVSPLEGAQPAGGRTSATSTSAQR